MYLQTLFKDSGTIQILGREMTDANVEIRENIGVVYDGDNFPGYLSAEQLSNIMNGIFKQWDDKLFQNYINSFHLSKKQKIKTYSKGMTMKLALAVALSHHLNYLFWTKQQVALIQ